MIICIAKAKHGARINDKRIRGKRINGKLIK